MYKDIIINRKMIENLESLLNNKKHEQALLCLTSSNFYHNVSHSNLNKLVSFIEGKLASTNGNQKLSSGIASVITNYPPSILIAIYSVIIIKSFKIRKNQNRDQNSQVRFNHKYAIEILSKLYNQKQLAKSNKEIIAALLLRIQTFSNHRMIVKSIIPKYIQEKNMIECRWADAFKKQAPLLFQDKWKQFKKQWPSCSPLTLQRDLADDFQQFFNLVFLIEERIKNQQSVGPNQQQPISTQQIRAKIQKQFQYISFRISALKKTDRKISIDNIFKMTTKILSIQCQDQKELLQQDIFQCQNVITESKNCAIKLVTQLLKILGTRLLPKIKEIYYIIVNGLENKQLKTDLILYIKLLDVYLSTFGDGSIEKNRILFQSQCSIQKIMDVILNSKFEQKKQQQLNFQRNKKQQQMGFNAKKTMSKESQIKHKQQLILNIGTNIQHHFEAYLNKYSQLYRQKLLSLCLFMLTNYYKNAFHQYKNAGRILFLVENSKNKISTRNQLLYKELKSSLFRNNIEMKPNFQYFCQEVFNSTLKLKNSKHKQSQQLKFDSKISNVCINPISFAFENLTSQSKPNNGQQSNLKHQHSSPLQMEIQSHSKAIKRTKSYEMQGWDSKDEGMKISANKSRGSRQPSDIFYSIKQCSVVQQGMNANQQDSFQSFTPTSKDKIQIEGMKDSFLSMKNSGIYKKQQQPSQEINKGEVLDQEEGYLLTPEF